MRMPVFNVLARLLHWAMALMVIAMLFIGVTMVASLEHRPWLISMHRPLGIAILILAIIRLGNRLTHQPPALPSDMPRIQVIAAKASHWILYALLILMPLLGWATVSASGEPVTLFAGLQLPAIVAHDPSTYAWLRFAHGWLARFLFAVIVIHISAALYHAWIRQDGVFRSMVGGERK